MVRRRGGRKRALGTRAPMELPYAINQRWSLGIVSDTLAGGRFRILCVVDGFSRECLATVAWSTPHYSSLGALTPREFADQQEGRYA